MAIKQIAFSYKSIGNFARLLVTIQIEKTKSQRDMIVFHRRFDKEDDEVFESFLCELYPSGVTIGEKEINELVSFVVEFMKKDVEAQNLYVDYDKKHFSSYVYFKVDNKVFPASHTSHMILVKDICRDYFKGFENLSVDYVEKFIKENFEIKSDFSSAESIVRDARYIRDCIVLGSDL